jgi:hypothetical protein
MDMAFSPAADYLSLYLEIDHFVPYNERRSVHVVVLRFTRWGKHL